MKSMFISILMSFILLVACKKDKTPLTIDINDPFTSHEYEWQIDTLGEAPGFSSLWDMAIINEKDIWVVGDIRMKDTYDLDSLGNVIQPYNAAHWDGVSWELTRLEKFRNGKRVPILPIRGVLPDTNGSLWLAAGSIYYWNDNIATISYRRDINTSEIVEKIIPRKSKLYGAGRGGILVIYDGNAWQKIDTHTDIALTDIWGQVEQSGKLELYATVSTENNDQDSKILKIENDVVTEVSSEGLPNDISGIWFDREAGYYVVGAGIFYTPELNDTFQWLELAPDITGYYTHAIAGNGSNDIFIVGSYGTVIHYNGSTWKNYSDEIPFFHGRFRRVEIKGNLVVAVGYMSVGSTRGVVLMGKRVNQ